MYTWSRNEMSRVSCFVGFIWTLILASITDLHNNLTHEGHFCRIYITCYVDKIKIHKGKKSQQWNG